MLCLPSIAIDTIMMSEENYSVLIERTQECFKADQPAFPPPISPELRQSVRKRKKKQNIFPLIGEMLRQRIPVWQAAASVAALFFITLFGLGRDQAQAPTVYVYLTDTIYKMIPASVIQSDWSEAAMQIQPTASVDASLYQERPSQMNNMNMLKGISKSLASAMLPDTGQLSSDTSFLKQIELLFHPGTIDAAYEQANDSFLVY